MAELHRCKRERSPAKLNAVPPELVTISAKCRKPIAQHIFLESVGAACGDDPGISCQVWMAGLRGPYSSSRRSETSTINLEGRFAEYIMCTSDRARVNPT